MFEVTLNNMLLREFAETFNFEHDDNATLVISCIETVDVWQRTHILEVKTVPRVDRFK